jgi:cytochrome b561
MINRFGSTGSRYHPALVALHWLLAIGIVFALAFGFFGVAGIPNTDPAKIASLRGHMVQGIAILALMMVRLVVRVRTPKPPAATTGFLVLDRLALFTHYAFYLVIFAMVGTGLSTAIVTGLFPIVFGGSGTPLPRSFLVYTARVAHGLIAWTIVALISLHVLAALFHQFIRKDGLLRRMWFDVIHKRARYHPVLVTLHWLLALVIIVSLAKGFFGLARISNTDPVKISELRQHMTAGMVIFTLMTVRLIVRMRTSDPPTATSGVRLLDNIARATHYGFYLLIFAMVGTGVATALFAGCLPIVYGGSAPPLPHTFVVYNARVAHGVIAWAIVAFIALHVIGAAYHQLVRKDRLLRRMWIGEESIPAFGEVRPNAE